MRHLHREQPAGGGASIGAAPRRRDGRLHAAIPMLCSRYVTGWHVTGDGCASASHGIGGKSVQAPKSHGVPSRTQGALLRPYRLRRFGPSARTSGPTLLWVPLFFSPNEGEDRCRPVEKGLCRAAAPCIWGILPSKKATEPIEGTAGRVGPPLGLLDERRCSAVPLTYPFRARSFSTGRVPVRAPRRRGYLSRARSPLRSVRWCRPPWRSPRLDRSR